jgi:hypothetical protein
MSDIPDNVLAGSPASLLTSQRRNTILFDKVMEFAL